MAGQQTPARPWRYRSAFTVDGAETRMGEWRGVDRYVGADRDVRASERSDGLDEWRGAAGAEAAPKISAPQSEHRYRPRRRADEDEIADGNFAIERHDPPQTERLARRQVEAQAARPADGGNRSNSHAGSQQDRERPPLAHPPFPSG